MKQTGKLDNACGVIACLHSIFNNVVAIELSGTLQEFYSQCAGQEPAAKALLLEECKDFQQKHKSFASQGQSAHAGSQSEVKHHFVAFVVNERGQLIELDGTKAGPHVIAENC